MQTFKSVKGKGITFMLLLLVMCNAFIFIVINYVNSYMIISLLKVILLALNVYQIYYILLWFTTIYEINSDMLCIKAIFGIKKVKIPLNEIEGYKINSGKIKGVKLYGIASNSFALGRSAIDKIGATRMFVTDNQSIIYLKTKEINYGISPVSTEDFQRILKEYNIIKQDWEVKPTKHNNLYKDKNFMIPLIIVSILIVILTVNPFVLYLKQKLPNTMPISFDAKFAPIKMGTGKQFAFTQMMYGALNMAILFCMYYAGYFCAKYDKKSSYKYIYVSLGVAVVFLFMQFKILFNYR